MRLLQIASFLALFALGYGTLSARDGAAAHKLTGQYIEFCSCERICESALGDPGKRSVCSFVVGLNIEAGQRGEVPLGGLCAALVVPDPSSVSARPGLGPVLYVDRSSPIGSHRGPVARWARRARRPFASSDRSRR